MTAEQIMELEKLKPLPTIYKHTDWEKYFAKNPCPKKPDETFQEYMKREEEIFINALSEEERELYLEKQANRRIEVEKDRAEQKKREFRDKQRHITELIHTARIPKIFRNIKPTDFEITSRNQNATECLKAIGNDKSFYIYGECGTGKTMLASIVMNERAKLLKPSMFIGAVEIFTELNPYATGDNRLAYNKRELIKNTPCLIIDDLGAEKPSDWTKQTLFEIINHRYNEQLQTIITSNFTPTKLQERLNNYEGERILRRIKAICKPVELLYYK